MYRAEYPDATNEEVQEVFDYIDLEHPDDDMLYWEELMPVLRDHYGFTEE